MKSYHLVDVPELEEIASECMLWLAQLDLLESPPHTWNSLPLRPSLEAMPSLLAGLRRLKLIPASISAVITTQPIHLHLDTPPVVAKLNFPICNTQHWTNTWVWIPDDVIDAAPEKKNHGLGQTGAGAKEFRGIDISGYHREDLPGLSKACVLNSSRPHGVYPLDPDYRPQRVLLSCTFKNEPVDWLR